MTTNDLEQCPKCGSDSIDIECWSTGSVPAEKENNQWIAVDSPALYVDWEYGNPFCTECGASV